MSAVCCFVRALPPQSIGILWSCAHNTVASNPNVVDYSVGRKETRSRHPHSFGLFHQIAPIFNMFLETPWNIVRFVLQGVVIGSVVTFQQMPGHRVCVSVCKRVHAKCQMRRALRSVQVSGAL